MFPSQVVNNIDIEAVSGILGYVLIISLLWGDDPGPRSWGLCHFLIICQVSSIL